MFAISFNSEFTLNLRHVYCYSELEDQSIKIQITPEIGLIILQTCHLHALLRISF